MTTDNNGAGIQVFYATPRRDDLAVDSNGQPYLKYQKRVARVEDALRAYLGSGISIIRYPYSRLDSSRGESATQADPRGLYLFQYDTDADGNGRKQWRLFYEDSVYKSPYF